MAAAASQTQRQREAEAAELRQLAAELLARAQALELGDAAAAKHDDDRQHRGQ